MYTVFVGSYVNPIAHFYASLNIILNVTLLFS